MSNGRNASLYYTIKWDGKRLSITGVEGPRYNGDCSGSCGTIHDSILRLDSYTEFFSPESGNRQKFYDIARRWHLNNMRAGTPLQESCLRENGFTGDYESVCNFLQSRGLLVDNGYHYGTKWLHEDVPQDVLKWLYDLPESIDELPPCWKRN